MPGAAASAARLAALVLACALITPLGAGTPVRAASDTTSAQQRLRQRFEAARAALATNDFGRPLRLESSDQDKRVRGEVLALIEQPLAHLQQALEDPWRWCEIMLLTPSISGCEIHGGAPVQLAVQLTRRFDQPSQDAFEARFAFHRQASNEHYSAVRLDADRGPVGTSDYRIEVEALALNPQRSVLRMAYSYRYGLLASLATKAYLATKSGDKVGFTRIDGQEGDVRIGGMRGSVERNAMRYYLAIEAHVAQSAARPEAPSLRLSGSQDRWLEAIARYPRQLAEPDPEAYRRVKRERFAAFASSERGRGG